jgi:hypothetical protein
MTRDGEAVPGVDHADGIKQRRELLGREVRRGGVVGGVDALGLGRDQRHCVGERERRALALVEQRRLTPGGEREQPLLRLAAGERVARVHVDAVGAAVEL